MTLNENVSSHWVRDFSPLWTQFDSDSSWNLIDLRYPKATHDDDFPEQLAEDFQLPMQTLKTGRYALAGGNFQSDDEALCFLTDYGQRWLRESYTQLAKRLGCKRSIIFDPLPMERTHHLDIFAMILPGRKVLVSEYDGADDSDIQDTLKKNYLLFEAAAYELIKIKTKRKGAVHYSYTNSVIVGRTAFVPRYNLPTDDQAFEVYRKLGYQVEPVDSKKLIELGGALHCVTSFRFSL